MVFLELSDDDNTARVCVEVGMFFNEIVPSLKFHFNDDVMEMNPETLQRIFKVAEKNINGILNFDRIYDWDCMAYIQDPHKFSNPIRIEKWCSDDEVDKRLCGGVSIS